VAEEGVVGAMSDVEPAVGVDEGLHDAKYERVDDKFLGKGSYGTTKLMRERATGHLWAIKYISRGEQITDHVMREIVNHRNLRHPFVVHFKEVLVTQTHLCVVMEYIGGGELFNYVQQRRNFSEAQARYFYQHLISGVEYLHRMRVVHRDLKLENTLVDLSQATTPRLKICDFGYSRNVLGSQPKTRIGTPAYIAPEVYQGQQPYDGQASDLWACAVLLYVMLVGRYPFQDPDNPSNTNATMWRVLKLQYDMPEGLSPECQDLLRRVFVLDPKQRATIEQIYSHPWFVKDLDPAVPLGDTQPIGADGELRVALDPEVEAGMQPLEEIKAIVNAARVLPRPAGGTLGGAAGWYDDEFDGDIDGSGRLDSGVMDTQEDY